jgi:glycosyltransferase involved in cell wall biosynthesis
MKIKYIDLIATSGIHSEINVALLKVIMLTVRNYNSVDFYAEKEHCTICQDKIDNCNVKFHPFRLLHKNINGGIITPVRDILSCFYVLKIFIFLKKEDFLFFALAYPFAHYTIYFLSKLFKHKVYLCQHGELDVFIQRNCFERNKQYFSLIRPLLKRKSGIIYLILGEPIFKHVQHLFGNTPNIIVIDHPYDFSINVNRINNNFIPLIIGQIGFGSKSKGTHHLFELAEMLKDEIDSGKLEIKLIGKLDNSLRYLDNNLVEYSNTILDTKTFEEKIKNLSFTLLLRDNFQGKAVASGTFFDTIKYEKPFLSLHNDYVSYYTQRYPESGTFFDTIAEIAEEIKKILDKGMTIDEYNGKIFSIKQIQQYLSLSSIAMNLRTQLQK